LLVGPQSLSGSKNTSCSTGVNQQRAPARHEGSLIKALRLSLWK
jgi:hypothetical protein